MTLFPSIRFKVTLWYMLILAFTLGVFSLLLYQNFRHSYYDALDDLISSRSEGIADAIDAYWEAERLDVSEGAKKGSSVFSKVNNINFAKIAQRWVTERLDDPQLMNIVIQIFDAQGKNVVASHNITALRNLPPGIRLSALAGKKQFYDFHNVVIDSRAQTFRVFVLPVTENHRAAYIVQVASPLTGIDAALNRLRAILLILVPLMLLMTGAGGVFLVKLTLSPVEAMIRTIHQITAENLKMRVQLPSSKDEINRLANTFNDMLERLEKTFASQQQFIQDIAHEFKTPLTILRGELEVTLKKLRSPEEYESVLHSGLEEVSRISAIFENLLLLAQLDTKKIVFQVRPVALPELLEKAADDIRVLAQQKNIGMEVSAEAPVLMTADEAALRRVILNLLDNAIKYTPENGRIRIALSQENGQVRISIQDTGMGMTAEQRAHIFDRFYRADPSRAEGGFGLGLSIVKSIVEAHHGMITVQSELDHGTTITLLFPTQRS